MPRKSAETLSGFLGNLDTEPRVGRRSVGQPWALRRNALGVLGLRQQRQPRQKVERTRVVLVNKLGVWVMDWVGSSQKVWDSRELVPPALVPPENRCKLLMPCFLIKGAFSKEDLGVERK